MLAALFRIFAFSLTLLVAANDVEAGLPRGVRITADEQTADEKTGATIAKGRAEISVEQQQIQGSAEAIEVRPQINEVLLKGRAKITVGPAAFEAEAVSCTLDFLRCIQVDQDQPLPASALPASAFAAETTSPR